MRRGPVRGLGRGLLTAGAAAACVGLWSCAAPMVVTAGVSALQVGTAAFINGELEAALVSPLDDLYAAALDAVKDLQFPITYERPGPRTAYIFAKETSGKKISIYLEKKSPLVTKIQIRVGVWGDQAISRLLLGEVQARTPAAPMGPTREQ